MQTPNPPVVAVSSQLTDIPTGRYSGVVKDDPQTSGRARLIRAGIDLFRRRGFVATSVEDICAAADLTKGGFFHHFDSKQALCEACLRAWDERAARLGADAPHAASADAVERLLGGMEFFIAMLEQPAALRSCLAGTTAQEVADTHPKLQAAASACFDNSRRRFQARLDEACAARGVSLDTASLAALWVAAIQGALILSKASQDASVIRPTLGHLKQYFESLLAPATAEAPANAKPTGSAVAPKASSPSAKATRRSAARRSESKTSRSRRAGKA